MNIFKQFAGWLRKKSAPPGNTPRVTKDNKLGRNIISYLRGDYMLQNSELLFAAVFRISSTFSAMPIQLYSERAPVMNDLNDLVGASPNPNMTSAQFFKTMEVSRDTSGNAYALKVLDISGGLERLDILDPNLVTPVMNDASGELWYKIKPDRAEPYFVHNFYVIHVPFLSTNGYLGINPVSVLTNTLDYNDKIQRFSREQIEKGVNAQIALEAPANLGAEQRLAMIKDFRETYKETGGDILLLESGVTAKTLNLSPIDAKVFEVEKLTRSKVAMVYGLPAHLLNDYSGTSFASQEQQALEFMTLTMLPLVTAYEQELNRKLLAKEQRKAGYNFRFDLESILRADTKTRADVHQMAIRSGWKTPNEVRGETGLKSRPEGDKLLVSRDLTPLEITIGGVKP
ncbi:portal protein [Clostridia bacterium]|nr:portal protein [Clostridia bacterium]